MPTATYDFIVIGAGSAGAAVAHRLSADPAYRVLLLEAGSASNFWSSIPAGFSKLIDNPAANWLYTAEPEASTAGRRLRVPRGKLLGGSSAINGLVFVRGQAQDFDTWAQMGNRGWSYADVLPFYKKLESYGEGEDEYRGRNGPVRLTTPQPEAELFRALIDAAAQAGIAHNPDYNGAIQEGIAMSQTTIADGKRMSTAACYLDPVRHRTNLDIVTDALTEQLVVEHKRCTAVRYSRGGAPFEAKVEREVVVSAGSVNSPQLLELSGIGQPERLRRLGIRVVHALPGVGENLRDHYAPRTRWQIAKRDVAFNRRARGLRLAKQIANYLLTGGGMIGMAAAPIRAFVKTQDWLETPDALLGWVPLLYEPGYAVSTQPGVTCYAHAIRPDSTGSIHLRSPDPRQPPAINFNFLSVSSDVDITLRAIRLVRKIMTAPAMQALQTTEIGPGPERQTDAEILEWVKAVGETTYHPVGTCKMGQDAMAVVDHELRVHGIEGLRVADASIMPTLTSGNTNAPAIMIGEKAAHMVLENARRGPSA